MKKTTLFIVFLSLILRGVTIAQNPYESIGKPMPKGKMLTLSNGKYQEFFPNDTLTPIGSVRFNTITGEVEAFLTRDTMYAEYNLEPEVASRWLSPDPLGAKYPQWSPYNYTMNNPVRFIDPDGAVVTDPDGNIVTTYVGQREGTNQTVTVNGDGSKTYTTVTMKADVVNIYANDGTAVEGLIIRSQSSTSVTYKDGKKVEGAATPEIDCGSNCHGTTFAKGKLWINNDQVQTLLDHDGYEKTDSKEKGDVSVVMSLAGSKVQADHSIRKNSDGTYNADDGCQKTQKDVTYQKGMGNYEGGNRFTRHYKDTQSDKAMNTTLGKVENGVRKITDKKEISQFLETIKK